MRFISVALVAAVGIHTSSGSCEHEQCELDSASMLQRAHANKPSLKSKARQCEKWYGSATYGTSDKTTPSVDQFERKLRSLMSSQSKVAELISDVREVIRNENDCWPQDAGSYGPLMIRLAWHCSGTYRASDGSGGCAGGRMRFSPEASWGDNGNLEKARALLKPIKKKFGKGLSWGDLYILAGTLAIHDMGGPTEDVCFGRVDDEDNVKSLMLNTDCDQTTGLCPDGPIHPGLIYVNPEGTDAYKCKHEGKRCNPDPVLSAQDVRVAFDRMGFSPVETVALVGGGHAFGQAHGACKTENCATKHLVRTSDFHGNWTRFPTKWDNEYFISLLDEEWEQVEGSGGKQQFQTRDRESIFASNFMTTADMAMKFGSDYSPFAKLFASSLQELDVSFAAAWRKLTTNGKGWLPRRTCIQFYDYEA